MRVAEEIPGYLPDQGIHANGWHSTCGPMIALTKPVGSWVATAANCAVLPELPAAASALGVGILAAPHLGLAGRKPTVCE
jgi:hypothetical protein